MLRRTSRRVKQSGQSPGWTQEQFEFVRSWTEALLAFGRDAFVRGTVTDVVAWEGQETSSYDSFHFALVGDAIKLATAFGYTVTGDESDEQINSGARTGPISSAARRHLRAKRMAEDLGHDRIVLSDFMDRLTGQAIHEFARDEMPFTEAHGAWILNPGHPWPEDDAQPFVYWSAKKKALVSPERPGWLIEVEDESEGPAKMVLGVNPCLVFPAQPRTEDWPVWARAKGTDIIVAHSMLLPADTRSAHLPASYRYQELTPAIEGVRSCGGLLFPSLSYGPLPASNFGPLTLVGHMGLVLDGLRPYKKRGVDPAAWVYEHDAWTIKTRELMTGVAKRIFSEMHGHEDYVYGHNLWTLGPPAELFGGPSQGSRPIRTVAQLVAVAKRRGRVFDRSMTREEFEETNERVSGTVDKYAYGEAKGRRVISLDEFPFFIGPEHQRRQMEAFASGVGYRGKLVTLDDPVGISENSTDYEMFRWSCIVADAVKRLAPPMEI